MSDDNDRIVVVDPEVRVVRILWEPRTLKPQPEDRTLRIPSELE